MKTSTRAPSSPFIVAVLLLRGGFNAWFTVWVMAHSPGWTDLFISGAAYAIADGALALVAGLLLIDRDLRGGWAMVRQATLADALLRLVVGSAILAFPALAGIPITILMLFAVFGVWEATVGGGVIAISIWLRHRGRAKRPDRTIARAVLDPVLVAGLVALVLAGAVYLGGPPTTAIALRNLVASGTGALALLLCTAGIASWLVRGSGMRGDQHLAARLPEDAGSNAPEQELVEETLVVPADGK